MLTLEKTRLSWILLDFKTFFLMFEKPFNFIKMLNLTHLHQFNYRHKDFIDL